MQTSNNWPVPIDGSLQITTSPGCHNETVFRTVVSVRGSVPRKEDAVLSGSASSLPSASNRTQVQSLLSETMLEKAQCRSVDAASSTMPTSRDHKILNEMGSSSDLAIS